MAEVLLTRQEEDLALRVLQALNATDEFEIFSALARPSWLDSFGKNSKDLGFGPQEAIDAISPVLLVFAPWAWSIVASEFQDQTADRFKKITRRAIGRKKRPLEVPAARPAVSEAELRIMLTDRMIEFGVKADRAVLLSRTLASETLNLLSRRDEQS